MATAARAPSGRLAALNSASMAAPLPQPRPSRRRGLTAPLGAVIAVGVVLLLRGRARVSGELALQQSRQLSWSARVRRLEHDIRTPVGAMAVALELLKTSGEPAVRQQATEVLERQIARMTSLTEEMRQLARTVDEGLR
jgi:signal transduction histidine kinase